MRSIRHPEEQSLKRTKKLWNGFCDPTVQDPEAWKRCDFRGRSLNFFGDAVAVAANQAR